MAWLRTRLFAPRKALSIRVNGVELVPQPQQGQSGTVDAMNGPKPNGCQIVALNDTLFLVTFGITAHYWEKYTTAPTSPVTGNNAIAGTVLYNRWRESLIVDDRNFTKRTRQGRFQIRSDNVGGFIPDQLRTQMAIVGIPTGFLRIRNEYTVTEDGLGMEYLQEDQEVFKLPPQPAFSAEGTLRINTAMNNMAQITASVRLKGDGSSLGGAPPTGISNQQAASIGKTLNQQALANRAVAIVMTKVGLYPYIAIQNAQLDINLYDNEVFFSCTVKGNQVFPTGGRPVLRTTNSSLPTGTGTTGGLAFFFATLSNRLYFATPYSDFGVNLVVPGKPTTSIPMSPPPAYLARGTAGLLLEAAAYYDPNLTNANVRTQGDSSVTPVRLVLTPQQTSQLPSQWQQGTGPLPMPGQTG